MRKFLLTLTVAAAALLAGCQGTVLDVPNVQENVDFALQMDEATILNRGNYYDAQSTNFIVTLNKLDKNGDVTRYAVAEIIADNVTDGIIPDGVYSIADGNMLPGAATNIISGSHFFRTINANEVITLATDGSLEVKYDAEAATYNFVLKFNEGVDAISGEASIAVECHLNGKATNIGAQNNTLENVKLTLASVEYDLLDDATAYWVFTIADNNYATQSAPAKAFQFILVTEIPKDGAVALPTGTFAYDNYSFFNANTVFIGAVVDFSAFGESPVYEEDPLYDGQITIKANGAGKYSIDSKVFCENGAYEIEFDGAVEIIDNTAPDYVFDQAIGIYLVYQGAPYYVLLLADMESDSVFQLYVNVATDSTFEDGIPSGTYVVGDDYSPGTIDVGYVNNGSAGGSLITNLAQNQAKALIQGGAMSIENKGDGTYAINLLLTDHVNSEHYGVFEGAITMEDQSGGEGGGGEGGGGEGGGNDSGLPVIKFNVDAAQLQFYGIGEWVLFIMDSTGNNGKGLAYMLDCWNEEDATFADGLASGTYTFADTCAPMTMYTGYVDSDGSVGGSLLLDGSLSNAYDIATNGTLEVVNNGDGTYAMTFDIWGLNYNGTGSLSGQIGTYDRTATTAPMAKSPAKSGGIKWANYDNFVRKPTYNNIEAQF